uniref:Uncharacterized protein n=1 Tax=Anas platyrhynchos platyrhynchos TaxID=8840 RepID=U3IJQ7_ANAPP
TASTPPAATTGTATFSWRGSTSTTMKPPVTSMSPVPSWWTWSPARWTPCAPVPLGRSSDQTTLSLVSKSPHEGTNCHLASGTC